MPPATKTITQLLAEFPVGGPAGGITPLQAEDLIVTLGSMAGSYDIASYTAAGSTQGTATVLTTYNAIISNVPNGTGVQFPNVTGVFFNILNRSANSVFIYPPSGVSIETLTANQPLILGIGQNVQMCINPLTPTTAYVVGSIPAPGGTPAIVIPYGVPIVTDGLANTAIDGGSSATYACTYRFQAPTTSNLTGFQLYWAGFDGLTTGYGAGTGGTARVILCPDDGSSNHVPVPTAPLFTADTTKTGGTNIVMRSNQSNFFASYTVNPTVRLTAGNIYHIYMNNVDVAPSTNWFSINATYWTAADNTAPVAVPWVPGGNFNNWALLYQGTNGGAWTLRHGYLPCFTLQFSDGTVYGSGYIARGSQRTVGPTIVNQVREVFTPAVTQVVNGVRVAYLGSGTPTCRLATAAGTQIDQATMSDDPTYGASSTWGYKTLTFGAPRTLTAGTSYHLWLTATSGSLSFWTIRKGSVDWAFYPKACFVDGFCQYTTTGVSTTNFGTPIDSGVSQWTNTLEEDLPFLFF